MTAITFQAISAATQTAGEPGHLVWVRDHLVALLVEAEGGWFLQHGLGPFDMEGLLFTTIGAAEDWILSNLPSAWLEGSPFAAQAHAEVAP